VLLPVTEHRPTACDVSDACDRLEIDATRTGALRPVWPEAPAISGIVRTVRLEPAVGASSPIPGLLALLAEGGADLWLVDLGGRTDVQCWGGVLAAEARRHGVAGALVNGAARDVEELQALRFPTYARGVHPAGAAGRLRLAAVDEPVGIDGVTIDPGSYVVADASGLVAFAAALVPEVLRAAEDAGA
jgi:regulator of RNase E activity RraA